MKRLFLGGVATLTIMTLAAESSGGGEANPLLRQSDAPFGAVRFDRISTSDYGDAIREGIRLHNLELGAISESAEAPTFENTIVAYDRSGSTLNEATLTLSNLESALGDTVLMNIMAELTPEISEHSTNVLLNEKLWKRIRDVYDNRQKRTDLSPEDMRLIEETYRNFAESGANLEGEAREKFRRLNAELSNLNVKFSQNVANELKDSANRLWVKEEDTAGLPESIKTAARAEAKAAFAEEGRPDDESMYLFTLYAPSYGPFMKYADNRALREKLYRMYGSRNIGGEYDNTQILKDIANVRLEIANLMGKETFADFQLQGTMAKTPAGVMNLLEQLREAYTEPMRAELREIEDFARKTQGDDFRLMAWDYSYWADKLKNASYAFSDEDMKPYSELDNTIKGVLGLATKLYGYKFVESKSLPVYHPDVKVFEVKDADGKVLGILYADFFYRPGKSPGAWMTEFRTEHKDDAGNKTLPLISIVCNFSKPVGNDPVLLTPMEVETFLHEFGHALHGLSAEAKYASLSGTNVYHDFVELFSQFNENYLSQKEFLDGFAKHYKTGKKMPQELIDKFVKSQQFGAAYACMRQLGFGYLDMAYHGIKEPLRASEDIYAFEAKAQDPVRCFDVVEGCMTSPSFGHIFSGGYAAGYYGYKWAELLDADAFAAFQENGIFDKKTAAKFRKMLQSGGTVDPMELYVEFRGKQPTIDALLRRDGIKK